MKYGKIFHTTMAHIKLATIRERSVKTCKEKGVYEHFRERMKTNENPAIKNPKIRGNNSYAKRVICNGKTFDCIKSCTEYYGVNYSSMRCWLAGTNKMPEYFKDKNLQYVGD